MNSAQTVFTKMYEAAQSAAQGAAQGAGPDAGSSSAAGGPDDDIIDGDFREV